MRCLLLVAAFAAVPFVFAPQVAQVSGGQDPDRRALTVVISTENVPPLAAVSISWTPPDWMKGYDETLEQLGASHYMRLGKGWWTTFDTAGTLEIGGTKIEAGSYYLGLAVAKDGSFRLLLFDSKQAMQSRWLPASTALYTGEARAALEAPLTFAKNSLKDVVVKQEIGLSAEKDDPANGRFSIRWGRHELSAKVRYDLAGVGNAAAPKK